MHWGGRYSWLLYGGVGFLAALLLAAIALPNLLRSRTAAPVSRESRTQIRSQEQSGLVMRDGMAVQKALLQSAAADVAEFDRQVIRTGSLDLVVSSPSTAVEQIASLAREDNGYVVSSQLTGRSESQCGNITIRVPAAQFDAVREQLKKLWVLLTFGARLFRAKPAV